MKKLLIILTIIASSFGVNGQTLRNKISIDLGDGSSITAQKLRNTLSYISDSTSQKVDKIIGKGLSTFDFNSTYKTALDGLNTNLSGKASILNPNFQGDVELNSIGNGVIIKSPNGTRFRLTVSNTGDIIATSL